MNFKPAGLKIFSICELEKIVLDIFFKYGASTVSVTDKVLNRNLPKTIRWGRPYGSWSRVLISASQARVMASLITLYSLIAHSLYNLYNVPSFSVPSLSPSSALNDAL